MLRVVLSRLHDVVGGHHKGTVVLCDMTGLWLDMI